jgi:hypothetical protein
MLMACISSPPELTDKENAVIIYSSKPTCKYENLGYISAQTGSVNWDVEGNEEASIGYLKQKAAKMGATGVILKASKTGERQWHSAGVTHEMSGDAIRCK